MERSDVVQICVWLDSWRHDILTLVTLENKIASKESHMVAAAFGQTLQEYYYEMGCAWYGKNKINVISL